MADVIRINPIGMDVVITPTMAEHILGARSYDGRTWHLYGRSQTLAALDRRGLADQRNSWDAVLTENGVMAFSWLLARSRKPAAVFGQW